MMLRFSNPVTFQTTEMKGKPSSYSLFTIISHIEVQHSAFWTSDVAPINIKPLTGVAAEKEARIQ